MKENEQTLRAGRSSNSGKRPGPSSRDGGICLEWREPMARAEDEGARLARVPRRPPTRDPLNPMGQRGNSKNVKLSVYKGLRASAPGPLGTQNRVLTGETDTETDTGSLLHPQTPIASQPAQV